MLTDTDVDLARADLARDLVYGRQAGGALAVHGVHGRRIRDSGVQRGHAGSGCAAARREDVADGDIFDERRVERDLRVDGLEDCAQDLLGKGVLETAFATLERAEFVRSSGCPNGLWCARLCGRTLVMAVR